MSLYFLIQFSSVAQSCLTLWDPMSRSMPGFPVHHQLPEFTQAHAHWISDAIQPSHPLSSPSHLPSIFPSIRVFSNESALCIRWPEYWSFSFNLSPCNEHGGLNSFRMDWLDLLTVQGTLKSLPQHHSSKASILQRSAFFMVQFSWSIPKMFSFFFWELLKFFPTYFWIIDSQKLKTYSAFSNKACMKLTTEGHEKVLQWWNYPISWLS